MIGIIGPNIMTSMNVIIMQNGISATILAIRLFACVYNHSIMIGSTVTINKHSMIGLSI